MKRTEPRILIREILTLKNYAFEATYTDEYFINNISSLVVTNIQTNPYYLLALINSKPVSIWYYITFDKLSRKMFPRLQVKELKQFPIPDATDEQQKKLEIIVHRLMKESKKEERDDYLISNLNTEIDEVVMELFKLTEDEKQSVREFEV